VALAAEDDYISLRVSAPSDSRERSAFTHGLTPVVLSGALIALSETGAPSGQAGGKRKRGVWRVFVRKVSVVLVDWSVRESFHTIEYLNVQTLPRSDYEVIWLEYYDQRPTAIAEYVKSGKVDKWFVLGQSGQYRKHLMYNEGIVASEGEIVVLCDGDAAYSPRFLESIVATFDYDPQLVLYLDQLRDHTRKLYPFKYIPWEVLVKHPPFRRVPYGLTTNENALHLRNYGACFCAPRETIVAAGGADEHAFYDSYLCGPYELGWRLINAGLRERWHMSEWSLHPWHPGVQGGERLGIDDGWGIASPALEIRKSGRVLPLKENEGIRAIRKTMAPREQEPTQAGNVIETRTRLQEMLSPSLRGKIYKSILYEAHRAVFPFARRVIGRADRRAGGACDSPGIGTVVVATESRNGYYAASTPRNAPSLGIEAIRSTGLVRAWEGYLFDHVYHRLGQGAMSEQLVRLCAKLRPGLLFFTPVSLNLEPSKEAVRRIIDELGIPVYVHCFTSDLSSGLKYEWLPWVESVGIMDRVSGPATFYESGFPHKFIYGFPAPSPDHFHPGGAERTIDVVFWGSVPRGSVREECISFLRASGIAVTTREHWVSSEEYANVLRRSRIALTFGDPRGGPGRLEARMFEAMACGTLVVNGGVGEAGKLFDPGKDFVEFKGKEQLLECVRYYLEGREEGQEIAESAREKVQRLYNPRNLWRYVFGRIGFGADCLGPADGAQVELSARLEVLAKSTRACAGNEIYMEDRQ
jgi:hypothetical protein